MRCRELVSAEYAGFGCATVEIDMLKPLVLVAATAVALSAGFTGSAQASLIKIVTINFDELAVEDVVTTQFPGVTFANTVVSSFGVETSPPNSIQAIDGGTVPMIGTALVATFSSAAIAVSLQGLNVGGNGIRIDAYDAPVGGSLVAFDEFIGTGFGTGTSHLLSVSDWDIFRVEFYQPLDVTFNGVVWDDFTFVTEVLEPGTLGLFGAGLLGLGLARRKKVTRR